MEKSLHQVDDKKRKVEKPRQMNLHNEQLKRSPHDKK